MGVVFLTFPCFGLNMPHAGRMSLSPFNELRCHII